jgi:ABC-type nitrate/sulfonate/bicarbonate transport system permease component
MRYPVNEPARSERRRPDLGRRGEVSKRLRRPLLAALGFLFFVAVWKLSHEMGWTAGNTLPDPFALPEAFMAEWKSGGWLRSVRSSLIHYFWGLAAGTGLGLVVGVAAALFDWFDDLHLVVARLLRPIPPLAWVFFAIAWFKVSHAGAAFVISIGVFWINYFASYAAVKGVHEEDLELARSFGHGGLWPRLRTVVFPSAAPGILAGVRTGLGQAWMTLIAAELFGVPGIGQEMNEAASLLLYATVAVYMLTIAAFYSLSDVLFGLVQRRLLRWRT